MIVAGAIFTYFAVKQTEKILYPQISSKEAVIATIVRDLVNTALSYGYRADNLVALDRYFNDIRTQNDEISYIALIQNSGKILYIDGDPCTDLSTFSQSLNFSSKQLSFVTENCYHSVYPVAVSHKTNNLFLYVGIKRSIIWSAIRSSLLEITTILFVSLLVFFEFTIFLLSRSVTTPLKSLGTFFDNAKKGAFTHTLKLSAFPELSSFLSFCNNKIIQINSLFHSLPVSQKALVNQYSFAPGITLRPLITRSAVEGRLPLFLVVFADAFSLSFLPLYVSTLQSPVTWISPGMLAGLPITVFMLFWAISLPSAASWSDRKGRYIPFITGAIITALGLAGTGTAQNIYQLLFWRAFTAVGFGIVYITSQGIILDSTAKENRTQGMATFLSAFFAGSLCGSSIGAIISEQFGYRITFLISSIIAFSAALCVLDGMSKHNNNSSSSPPVKKLTLSDVKTVLQNSRFISVLLFSAIPAKICLVGYIYYAIPVVLKSFGTSQSTIGRIIMTYGFAIVIMSPLIAKLADKFKNPQRFIIIGGYTSAISLLLLHIVHDRFVIYGFLAATILLGIAHSISVSSQLVFITESFEKRKCPVGTSTVIALFRLFERSGNIIGPLLVAFLLNHFGNKQGITILGLLTLSGTLFFWFSGKYEMNKQKRVDIP
jgi:predicted MFS family arabinose efflux permease